MNQKNNPLVSVLIPTYNSELYQGHFRKHIKSNIQELRNNCYR